jgi:hypothetical protein
MKTRKNVLAVALALGLLGSAAPAQAATTVVEAGGGTLLARGVAVEGSYTVTCPEGDTVQLATSLAQRVRGGRVAFGRGDAHDHLTCTGQAQEVSYVAFAFPFGYSGALAFDPGPALLRVAVLECAPVEGGEHCEVVGEIAQEIVLREE